MSPPPDGSAQLFPYRLVFYYTPMTKEINRPRDIRDTALEQGKTGMIVVASCRKNRGNLGLSHRDRHPALATALFLRRSRKHSKIYPGTASIF